MLGLCSATSLGAEPKAVLTGPREVAEGSIIFLDASLSQSDRPVIWKVLTSPTPLITLDKDDRKGVYAILPTAPAGLVRIAVIAIGTPDKAKDPDVAVALIEVRVGAQPTPPTPQPAPTPQPSPAPSPTPSPSPAPADPFGKLGYDYARSVIHSYADTFDESASMLAAGVSRQAVSTDFDKRWRERRNTTFAPVASEFARIAPDDREPSADERARLAEAWKAFARGLRAR